RRRRHVTEFGVRAFDVAPGSHRLDALQARLLLPQRLQLLLDLAHGRTIDPQLPRRLAALLGRRELAGREQARSLGRQGLGVRTPLRGGRTDPIDDLLVTRTYQRGT